VLECSSHALELGRLAGLRFRAAGFTNLTQDHLDFHGTMERYFLAKERLFAERLRPEDGVGVALVDTDEGERILSRANRRMRCSVKGSRADVFARRFRSSLEGIEVELETPLGCARVRSPLVGEFNVANVVLAVGIACALAIDLAAIEKGVGELEGVPGRLERVPNRKGIGVFVDYAHTPDALERAIAALRPLVRGRLLCVFGCGGDRDRGKRPKMGQAAALGADRTFVTSDNPRTEQPRAIIDMIVEGVRALEGPSAYEVEPDRRLAIRAAIAAARPGDAVLIAGKGHEDYQILGTTRIHFDDREEARAALEEL
jgi:UDP-N-acetylmuramoyl-L-alanyl-D-glutamate--2,6-diaminopimelate ligase